MRARGSPRRIASSNFVVGVSGLTHAKHVSLAVAKPTGTLAITFTGIVAVYLGDPVQCFEVRIVVGFEDHAANSQLSRFSFYVRHCECHLGEGSIRLTARGEECKFAAADPIK